MAKVQLSNVVVLDNPSPFLNPFQFELTFECIEDLNEGIKIQIINIYNLFILVCKLLDLEWKMIYVGSAESEEHDQILDVIYVGPVPEGRHMFVFEVILKNSIFFINSNKIFIDLGKSSRCF